MFFIGVFNLLAMKFVIAANSVALLFKMALVYYCVGTNCAKIGGMTTAARLLYCNFIEKPWHGL